MFRNQINSHVSKALILFGALLCFYGCGNRGGGSESVLTGDALSEYTLQQINAVFDKIPDTVFVVGDKVCNCLDYRSVLAKKADTAFSFVGVREVEKDRGPIVDLFFKDCGVQPGLPWCACFVNHNLLLAGGRGPGGPAWSPSWFPERRIIWKRGERDITFPKGTVIGIWFQSLGRIGHVGIVYEDLGNGRVRTVEGNTNNNGSRVGDGVYFRERDKAQIYAVSDWGY